MKIGILTFHNAMNYGAVLQCYALQSYIEEHYDCEVSIVDYTPKYFKKVFFDPMKPLNAYGMKNKIRASIKFFLRFNEGKKMSKKYKKINDFIDKYLYVDSVGIDKADDKYDIFITGSDQIWNLEMLENDTTYLLDFVDKAKKVSYAASFKISDVDEYAENAYKRYLPLFDAISVRESNLKDYVIKKMGLDATSVIDPTMLAEKKVWESFVDDKKVIEDDYILIYYVNRPQDLVKQAIEYARNNNLKIVSLNTLKESIEYKDYSMASIEEFLNLIANAKAVFTTSFHGMAFAINFKTEFYFEVPENSYNNNERLLDLAKKLGLADRNIALNEKFDAINWNEVDGNLERERGIASEFLDKALKE